MKLLRERTYREPFRTGVLLKAADGIYRSQIPGDQTKNGVIR